MTQIRILICVIRVYLRLENYTAMKARLVWLVLCVIWGSTWLFIKFGLEALPPLLCDHLFNNSHSRDQVAASARGLEPARDHRDSFIRS
jgi:hypothetical protein